MAKDVTYKDFKKTLRRTERMIRFATWIIQAVAFLWNLNRNIDKIPALRITALVISSIFEVTFWFIAAHFLFAYYVTLLGILMPLILTQAIANMVLIEIYTQCEQYRQRNGRIKAQLALLHLSRLEITGDHLLKANRNFKRMNYNF